ncbi:MAG: epoxyqueuosine reductase [Candidatus Atribacteria bacterium]
MKKLLIRAIKDYVKNYRRINNTKNDWNEPLVAFASVMDPLFFELKKVVNISHNLPTDLMEDAQTVISYFISFQKEIVTGNTKGKIASEGWVLAYIETNKLIIDLNEYIAGQIAKADYKSVVLPPTHNFDKVRLVSDWSHKHIGYIAGLGKFGLHQMLISDRGCCGRLGSMITNLKLEPTKRPIEEYCLNKHNKSCGECVKKCINGALQIDNFDKYRCYEKTLLNAEIYKEKGLADVCGKCISVVPCSFTNPVA